MVELEAIDNENGVRPHLRGDDPSIGWLKMIDSCCELGKRWRKMIQVVIPFIASKFKYIE